jgi:triosephosphate isomerase
MRTPIIAANWKMNKTTGETEQFFQQFTTITDPGSVEVVFCPSFPLLAVCGRLCREKGFRLGAQNMHWETAGAYTGEVSPLLLQDLGAQYVIVGHSERRQLFAETDRGVARKVKSAFAADLIPIVCVGETLKERQSGETDRVVAEQLTAALTDLDPSQVRRLVIAYEPVWAIGSGLAATLADAGWVATQIRKLVGEKFSRRVARDVRIQYGGSVSTDNIMEFISHPEIDGALVGGASLDAGAFAGIIQVASRVKTNVPS